MAKKFWLDWQKRVGETDEISIWNKDKDHSKILYYPSFGDRLIKATFNGDTVDLIVEVQTIVLGKNGYHGHSENRYFTLHREDIKTIYFKQY